MNMMEDGKTSYAFSKTLNSVFNKCAARLRVALNKQDDLIVSGRYRFDYPAEHIKGAALNFDFNGAEIEAVAKHKGNGRYEVFTNGYIESAISHNKRPKLKLPFFCVNEYASEGGEFADVSKEKAIKILAEFDGEMSATDKVTAVENAPRQALHYKQHETLKM